MVVCLGINILKVYTLRLMFAVCVHDASTGFVSIPCGGEKTLRQELICRPLPPRRQIGKERLKTDYSEQIVAIGKQQRRHKTGMQAKSLGDDRIKENRVRQLLSLCSIHSRINGSNYRPALSNLTADPFIVTSSQCLHPNWHCGFVGNPHPHKFKWAHHSLSFLPHLWNFEMKRMKTELI